MSELERRMARIEEEQAAHRCRLTEGIKTFARHELRLESIEDYQAKQNGAVYDTNRKIDEFIKEYRLQREQDREALRQREELNAKQREERDRIKAQEDDARWTKITWLIIGTLVSVVLLLLRG